MSNPIWMVFFADVSIFNVTVLSHKKRSVKHKHSPKSFLRSVLTLGDFIFNFNFLQGVQFNTLSLWNMHKHAWERHDLKTYFDYGFFYLYWNVFVYACVLSQQLKDT